MTGYSYPQAPAPGLQSNRMTYNCRPVTSREEAVAAQTDYFSLGTVMPDLPHGRVYIKRFDPQTGSSDFLEFAYQAPEPPKPPQEYATVEMLRELEKRIMGEKNE